MGTEHSMTLKRALSLLNMPSEWFNTSEKMELRNKAVEFLGQHKDAQNLYRGKVTSDDKLSVDFEAKRIFNKKYLADAEPSLEAIELEGKNHGLDRQMLDMLSRCKSKNLPEGLLENCIRRDATRNIQKNGNCANSYIYELLRNEDGSDVTSLDAYARFVDIKLKQLEGNNKKKADPEAEEIKATLNNVKRKIEELQAKKMHIEKLERYSRSEALEPLLKKQQEYDDSLKRVCAELGLNIDSKENMKKVESYVQSIVGKISSHEKYHNFLQSQANKQTPSYRTETNKITDELTKDDDSFGR